MSDAFESARELRSAAVDIAFYDQAADRYVTLTAHEDGPRFVEPTRTPMRCFVHLTTGMSILDLCRAGAISLDVPVATYLPELESCCAGREVTVRHLMMHSAGYQGLTGLEMTKTCRNWPEVVAHLNVARQLFTPGTVFDSQRMNTVVLGEIVSRVSRSHATQHSADLLRRVVGAEVALVDTGDEDGRNAWDDLKPNSEILLTDVVALGRFIAAKGSGERPDNVMWDGPRNRLPLELDRLPIERFPSAFGLAIGFYSLGFAGADGTSRKRCFCLRFDHDREAFFAVLVRSPNIVTRSRVVDIIYRALKLRCDPACEDVRGALDLADFRGVYLGTGRTIVASMGTGNALELLVVANGGAEARVRVSPTVEGRLKLDPQFVSLALFRDPVDGEAAMMIGQNAYKRINDTFSG